MERIRSLRVYNFRNLQNQQVEIPDGLTVLVGENMQGKTSFLEAVFLASTGRSFRTRSVADLIKWGENQTQVGLEFDGSTLLFGASVEPKSRSFTLNGERISSAETPLAGQVLYYSDEYLNLVETAAGLRRLFDRLMELSDIKNLKLSNEYRKLLAERNAMLSSGFLNEPLNDVLTERIDAISEEWRDKRVKFLQLVEASLNLRFAYVFQGDYRFSFSTERSDIRNLQLEMQKKFTMFGYHRDKISLLVNGKSVNTFGSRGFLKTLLTFIFVRTAELVHEQNGYVLLLLDDFNANVDDIRWKRMLKLLPERQIIAATTKSWDQVNLGRDYNILICDQGTITPSL
ncbi:DNA replication/repair protein RecF [Coprothermobacter platensis]|uniref:DNA replication/repair protein RecF n=1 Tax=Coprothermobacter platensis TaxID=108819 RepID=UPI0012EAB78C|nr:AAA family ATPase [Coprothermobacter platensis]